MKPIKIYGESKTGTTYLQELLKLNVDAEIIEGNDVSPLGWKHGFPEHGEATYIFVFRDVYETIKSLKADGVDKRFQGLKEPFGSVQYHHWHRWKSYFECRNAKYYAYLGFSALYPSVLVNVSSLPKAIIKLSEHGYNVKSPIKDIKKHVYRDYKGRENPKREDLTAEEIEYIDKNIDPNLENFINRL